MEKKNIEDLSNLVFGLALTLGALTLVPPSGESFEELLSILLSFGLSFLIILWFWWIYNSAMKHTRMDRQSKYALNFVLLFLVVIEPYLLSISDKTSGATAYALDIGSALLIFVMLNQFSIEEIPAKDDAERERLTRSRNVLLICAFVFFASNLIQFVPSLQSAGVQGLVWLSVLLIAFLSRLLQPK